MPNRWFFHMGAYVGGCLGLGLGGLLVVCLQDHKSLLVGFAVFLMLLCLGLWHTIWQGYQHFGDVGR